MPNFSRDCMQHAAASRRSYTRAIFRTHAHLADEAAGILVAGGAIGCAVAGMKLPRAREDKTVALEAYFDRISATELSRLRLMMEQAGMLADAARDGSVRRIVDPGWSTLWMKRFGPFRVGRRMLIVPPWKRENEPGRTTVVVHSARAFGTGHHPTTAGALRAIESIVAAHAPRSILDAGTGSGVLAIAASLLGKRNAETIAIDIDPTALENARANARLNGVEKSIRFSSVPLASIHRHFDLIVANILSGTLIELAPHLKQIVAPGGRLVLGGFLADEADDVLDHYRPPLRCLSRKTHRGWTTLVMSRAPR
ncbi:MAG TPA: 50S ribosomal protein L11 methyltransferase [Candidatus Binatus sp.]|uniref:50S ribosomal protein L11 methyltransferase n=1 Tax=Candidatus Binatus sp. TaxID=2811406 RepID=UPI002B46AB52|nr:50S ribosomal protein L11 methyltransferase [Candidatus Binatus sp.]HKN13429.1 50S ribosomal protein L11 methyltransferase [Candidatus Binatus sp.]